MNFDKLEGHGRTIMVQFRCYRCRATAVKPLSDSLNSDGTRGLYDLVPPSGWRNGGFYYPLFCPKCKEKYDRFMSGEEVTP